MSTLLFYNFKGGVGKTTISVLAADQFSRAGKKVLLVDLDAQASATLFFENSYGAITPTRSLFNSLQKESLRPSICHLDDNLDLIPGDWDMSLWNQTLEKLPQRDRNLVLKHLDRKSTRLNYKTSFRSYAQASDTLFFENSYGAITPTRSLFNSLQKESLRPSICHLDDNLDLIPGDWDMSLWNQTLEKLPQRDRNLVLKH